MLRSYYFETASDSSPGAFLLFGTAELRPSFQLTLKVMDIFMDGVGVKSAELCNTSSHCS